MRHTLIRRLISATALVTALAFGIGHYIMVPVGAQTSVQQTTTAAAVTVGTTTVSLTSATNVAVGSELFMDREAMLVNALSGTIASVTRGYDGSAAAAHASGATVYAGPTSGTVGSPFVMQDPPYGTCTSTGEVYSLRINPVRGFVWKCSNGEWESLNNPFRPAVHIGPKLGAAIASAATIAPVSYITHVTGTTTINTVTVPPGCEQTCQLVLVPDALWSTGTSGNIYIATTGVVSKALILTWDGTKWSPSY